MSKCKINFTLLPAKAVLFFLQGADTILTQFLSLYFVSIGLTVTEAGIIGAGQPFLKFLASPVLCGLADRFKCHKTMFILVILLNVTSWLSILGVPNFSKQRLHCDDQHSIFIHNFSVVNDADLNATINMCQIECTIAHHKQDELTRFCYNSSAYDSLRNLLIMNRNKSTATFPHQYVITGTESMLSGLINSTQLANHYEDRKYDSCRDKFVMICDSISKKKTGKYSLTFWLILILYTVGSVFMAPVFNLADAMVYNVLDSEWSDWGKQHLWGSISKMITVVGATTYLNFSPTQSRGVSYSPCLYIFAAHMILCALSSSRMRMRKKVLTKDCWTNAWSVLKSFKVVCLLITIVTTGIYASSIVGFLFVHLSLHNTASIGQKYEPIIFGLYVVTDAIFEIPALYFLGNLIKRLGPYSCLIIASLTYAIRLVTYTFITNAWWVILTAPLNTLTFILVVFTITSYANMITLPELGAIAQGIVGAFHTGIGFGIGILLTGYLFDEVGSIWTYRVYAFSSVFLLIPFICLQRWFFKDSITSTQPERNETSVYDAVPRDEP